MCVRGIDCAPLSTILRWDFWTVLTVWYFLVFQLIWQKSLMWFILINPKWIAVWKYLSLDIYLYSHKPLQVTISYRDVQSHETILIYEIWNSIMEHIHLYLSLINLHMLVSST
jgi:hypothetical protein